MYVEKSITNNIVYKFNPEVQEVLQAHFDDLSDLIPEKDTQEGHAEE